VVKNLTIKDEAYAYLRSQKRSNESFSDVILRMQEKESNKVLLNYCGKLPGLDAEKRKKEIAQSRKEFGERF